MNIRAILRIAKWEVTAGSYFVNRKTLVVSLVALISIIVLIPVVFAIGSPHDAGIYRVGIDDSDQYFDAVADDRRLAIRDPSRADFQEGQLEILVTDNQILVQDTQKGRAASSTFESAVESYNTQVMRQESNQSLAFPVQVELQYVERNLLVSDGEDTDGSSETGEGSEGDSGGDDSGSGTDSEQQATPTVTSDGPGFPDRIGLPSFQSRGALFGQSSGAPTDITPPFPFVSLVLAFMFVIPMNFVIQAYASSILHERNNRRGELLLVTPLSRLTIVSGKTLPYFIVMLCISIITTVLLGGGIISVSATVPIALLFLGSGFLSGLIARSHKELSFLLVTVSVGLTTFVFVPAIFINLHPIASISPLTPIVHELEGSSISLGSFLFSTVPLLVVAGMLFIFGIGMYREEDLFSHRPVDSKVLDALANFIHTPRSAAVLTIAMIPFVFVLELLSVSMLFIFPLQIGLPLLFVAIAVIEEFAKSIHIYAGFRRARFTATTRTAVVVGLWSGLGFFIAEKGFLVAQLVGLGENELARYAFETSIGLGDGSVLLLPVLFLLPLVLHGVTATISSVGAMRGRMEYVGAVAIAVVIHTLYNLGMVVLLA